MDQPSFDEFGVFGLLRGRQCNTRDLLTNRRTSPASLSLPSSFPSPLLPLAPRVHLVHRVSGQQPRPLCEVTVSPCSYSISVQQPRHLGEVAAHSVCPRQERCQTSRANIIEKCRALSRPLRACMRQARAASMFSHRACLPVPAFQQHYLRLPAQRP